MNIIKENKIKETTEKLLSEINYCLNINEKETKTIKDVFSKNDILIDNGQAELINQFIKIDTLATKEIINKTILLNNLFWIKQNDFETMMPIVENNFQKSANEFKKDIFEILLDHNKNINDIKNNKSNFISNIKDSLILDNYENTCKKINEKFDNCKIKLEYKELKEIIKLSKDFEDFKIIKTLQINEIIDLKIENQINEDIKLKNSILNKKTIKSFFHKFKY